MEDSTLVARGMEIMLEDPTIRSIIAFNPRLNTSKHRVKVTTTSDGYRVTIGQPNYAERMFLKLCRKANCNPKQFWIRKRRSK
jgi:hypothetical protein